MLVRYTVSGDTALNGCTTIPGGDAFAPAPAAEGQPYTLSFPSSVLTLPSGIVNLTSWTVHWGDGTSDRYPVAAGTSPDTLTADPHTYPVEVEDEDDDDDGGVTVGPGMISVSATGYTADDVLVTYDAPHADLLVMPLPPTDLAVATESNAGEIDLTWTDASGVATVDQVTATPTAGGGPAVTVTVPAGSGGAVVAGLTAVVTYSFSVTAIDQLSDGSAAASDPSAAVTAAAWATPPVPPVVTTSGSATVAEGGTYAASFTSDSSAAGAGVVTGWDVDWGDGSYAVHYAGADVAETHTFGPGTHAAVVTATADVAATASVPAYAVPATPVVVGVVPTPPTVLTATVNSARAVTLNWTDPTQCTFGYAVLREDPGSTTYDPIGLVDPSQDTFTDDSVSPASGYSYEVAADGGADGLTAAAPATASATTPDDQVHLSVAAEPGDPDHVVLNWSYDGGDDLGGYELEDAHGTSNFQRLGDGLPYASAGLTSDALNWGEAYTYRIRADFTDGTVGDWVVATPYPVPILAAPAFTADTFTDSGGTLRTRVAWTGIPADASVKIEVNTDTYAGLTAWHDVPYGDDPEWPTNDGSGDTADAPPAGAEGYAIDPGVTVRGGRYDYRVCYVADNDEPSYWTAGQTVSLGDAAGPGLTLAPGTDGTAVTVSWTVPGAAADTSVSCALYYHGRGNQVIQIPTGNNVPADNEGNNGGTSGVGPRPVSYTLTGLTPGTTYDFSLITTTAGGGPAPAYAFSTASATTAGTPPAGSVGSPNVAVSTLTDDDTAFIHWFDQTDDEDGFDVYRSTDPTFQTGVTLVGQTGADENQYTAALPDQTDTFYYHVYAYRNDPPAGTSDDDNDGVEGQIALPADQPAGVPTPPGVAESTYSANTAQGGLALRSVQFGGVSAATQAMTSVVQASKIQPILRDNGSGAYDNTQPQWLDANADGTIAGGPSTFSDQTIDGKVEHQWPLSYERSQGSVPAANDPNTVKQKLAAFWSYMAATPTFVFAGQEPGGATWEVQGLTNVAGLLTTSPPAGNQLAGKNITFGPAILHQQGGTLSAYALASQALPNTIQCELMVVTWQVSFDGGKTWVTPTHSTSKDWLYVTGGSAGGKFQPYQTELWLGCGGAIGLQPGTPDQNSTVVSSIWTKKFAGPANVVRVDGAPLTYYKNWLTGNTTDAMLLRSSDGQCGSWASLMFQTVLYQGAINSGVDKYITVKPIDGSQGFIVKNFQFNGNGDQNQYPYLNVMQYPSAAEPFNSTGFSVVVGSSCRSNWSARPKHGKPAVVV